MNNLKVKLGVLSVLSVATFSLLTTGCTSEEELHEQQMKVLRHNHTVQKLTSKDLIVTHIDDKQLGAAVSQGGYKHVLFNDDNLNGKRDNLDANVRYDRARAYTQANNGTASKLNSVLSHDDLNKEMDLSKVDSDELLTEANKQLLKDLNFKTASTKDYSYYELGRWERFCNAGKNMDRRDWTFVKKNKERFPIELLDRCSFPSMKTLAKHGITGKTEPQVNKAIDNTKVQKSFTQNLNSTKSQTKAIDNTLAATTSAKASNVIKEPKLQEQPIQNQPKVNQEQNKPAFNITPVEETKVPAPAIDDSIIDITPATTEAKSDKTANNKIDFNLDDFSVVIPEWNDKLPQGEKDRLIKVALGSSVAKLDDNAKTIIKNLHIKTIRDGEDVAVLKDISY